MDEQALLLRIVELERRLNNLVLPEVGQPLYRVYKVLAKAAIPDNVATAIFTVTTTNEAGNTDGGGYACFTRAYIGHGTSSATAAIAARLHEARFARVVPASGARTATSLSAVTEVADDNLAETAGATRSLGAITPTVAATTNYIATFSLQIDTTGLSATTAEVLIEVEVLYYGFLTAPVIAAA